MRFYSASWIVLAVLILLTQLNLNQICAQEYELSDGRQKSKATFKGGKLLIENQGSTFIYNPHAKSDSSDGKYGGYYCADVDSYLRWPKAGSGHLFKLNGRLWIQTQMKITGAKATGSKVTGSTSKASKKSSTGLEGDWEAKLGNGSRTRFLLDEFGDYRFEKYDEFDDLTEKETGQWVVTKSKTDPKDFTFSCKSSDGFKTRFNGRWNNDNTRFRLTDKGGDKYTYNRMVTPKGSGTKGGSTIGGGFRSRRNIVREFIPNPELASVKVVLKNSHSEELVIMSADHLPPRARGNDKAQFKQITIAPNGETTIEIARDSGGTVVATDVTTGTIVSKTAVAAKPLHDIVVYENRVQSVYIDGTKNPPTRVVEKGVKSVGVYTIPAGDSVKDGETIDIYKSATRANNAGAASRYPKLDK